jgi:sec-independent protein translocase protein TatA
MFGELFTPTHLIFVLIIALIIFGPKRLPEIGRGLGKGIREFKGTMTEAIEAEELHEKKSNTSETTKTS